MTNRPLKVKVRRLAACCTLTMLTMPLQDLVTARFVEADPNSPQALIVRDVSACLLAGSGVLSALIVRLGTLHVPGHAHGVQGQRRGGGAPPHVRCRLGLE